MAFARGKFGIEYNPTPRREEPGPFVPIVIALVFAVALVSLVWTIYGRLKGDSAEAAQVVASVEEDRREAAKAEATRERMAESSVSFSGVADIPAHPAPSSPAAVKERPVQVRNLLKRLDEAVAKRDVEMAVTTIEQLRALPGKPAADLDDALAKRLGRLNLQRLFTMRSPLWTIDVTVGRGDSVSRIAYEHGSTLASVQKLNPSVDVNRVLVGQKLKVMNHPVFRLLVTRSSRTADLLLNGRFFKRYYLDSPVTGTVGTYALPDHPRTFWSSVGLSFARADRLELELLMPKGSAVVLADY